MTETRKFTTDADAAAYCKRMDELAYDLDAEKHADGTWTVTATPLDFEVIED